MKKFSLMFLPLSMIFLSLFVFNLKNLDAAESLDQTLKSLSEDAAKSYVSPIVSGFGADMNSGWFTNAVSAKKFGFDFELGVVAMGAFLDDSSKTFSSSGKFRFDKTQAADLTSSLGLPTTQNDLLITSITNQDFTVGISGPTITGGKTNSIKLDFPSTPITVTDPNTGISSTHTIPVKQIDTKITGLLDNLSILPYATPQLGIGTIFGTSLKLRMLPKIEVSKEIGKFDYLGYGIMHNPMVWFPVSIPVDVSLMYFTQTLKVGNIMEANASSYGANVSKKFGIPFFSITPYAGFMLESSDVKFTYDYVIDTPTGPNTQSISFKMDGENTSRVTLGARAKLLIIDLFADYSLGKYNVASGGLMFSF